MRDHASRPVAAGRHTLGSSPESLEPRAPVPAPRLPSVPPSEAAPDPSEPWHTIYAGPGWHAARARLDMLTARPRELFTSLMDSVESAWGDVRELQVWYEENSRRADGTGDYADLLNFIDADLVDIFREIAAGVADLVPGGGETNTDPDEVGGDLESFRRYFNLFRLSATAAVLPDAFGTLVEGMSFRLLAWADSFAGLLARMREVVE